MLYAIVKARDVSLQSCWLLSPVRCEFRSRRAYWGGAMIPLGEVGEIQAKAEYVDGRVAPPFQVEALP